MNDRLKFRLWDKGNERYVVRADLFYIKPSGEIICGYYDFVEDIYIYILLRTKRCYC